MSKNIIKGYIGTYTTEKNEGIYSFTFTNKFSNSNLAFEIGKPSYLSIDRENNILFSIAKSESLGGIASFDIENDMSLKLRYTDYKEGNPPCHLSLSDKKNILFSSNYHDNELTIYSLDNHGFIKNKKVFNHNGTSLPHIHFSAFNPNETFMASLDLGLDEMKIYEYKENKFIPKKNLNIKFKHNCGPRHMIFHPSKNFAYVLTEYTSEIYIFKYNHQGEFSLLNIVSTLPNTYKGVKSGAAIKIHPNGKYLYTSNRGHNSIAIFEIDLSTGGLNLLDFQHTFGNSPRDFSISLDGNILMVANQDSSSVIAFSLNSNTGLIDSILDSISISMPTCISFL